MAFKVLQISGAQTLPLRQNVLKPFASLIECAYAEDALASTYHFGLYLSDELIGVATFILQNNPDLKIDTQKAYRLRGMAIDNTFQGKGYGQTLLRSGVEYLESLSCDLIWFNARLTAFEFYEKLGFIQFGPLFELPNIGPHKVMYKILIPR